MEPTPRNRPHILLICVDQMRGDALSLLGHPVVRTPYLDQLGRRGTVFTNAYSATPTCVPARVALFTGQSPEAHGRYGYREGVPFTAAHGTTVATVLGEHGYQTQAIGKMHVFPERSRAGFDNVVLHDGFLHFGRRHGNRNLEANDDYLAWLHRQPGHAQSDHVDHGAGCNSQVARPWDKAEALHPTTWTVTQAIDFLRRRDTTAPFFLYLSFHRPHAPYDPPQWLLEQYLAAEHPDQVMGDWVADVAEHLTDGEVEGEFTRQPDDVRRRVRAGYWGLISQIDFQVNRLMEALSDHGLLEDTAVVFTSDHGDMMGDHHMWRKTVGYEGSAKVPLIVTLPPSDDAHPRGALRAEVAELRDVMPTLLGIAGVTVPHTVDGRSLLPLARGDDAPWRTHIHGEHTLHRFGMWQANHWVTDGHHKLMWFSGDGRQQFFDLDADPHEEHDLIDDPSRSRDVALWRGRLVEALTGREEGFVADGDLVAGRPVTTESSRVQQVIDEWCAG
ncbi:arylsulfatase [Tessaracoccus antarcticus]|uniref:Arylsulfatase n=1 Tax=Tessaracoccus antarcticus TaxID=2479848 RepID=A0A3M0GLB5_9ACTN|nr:arylsulfatase [Tessaracoccus antarcticus]RMB61939.1 arylsulfatase [Tessaracoccus antarcticus]